MIKFEDLIANGMQYNGMELLGYSFTVACYLMLYYVIPLVLVSLVIRMVYTKLKSKVGA